MSDRVLLRPHFSLLCLASLFLASFAAGFLWRDVTDAIAPGPAGGRPLPPLQNASTEPITLRVNGTRYVIPLNYFRYPSEGGDAVETGFLLRVEWPNLTGYAPDWDTERVRGWGERMNILVGKPYGDDLRRLVGVHIQNLDIFGDFPVHDGLYHAPIYKLEPLPREDIYFMRKNGRFPFVLVCSRYDRPDRWDSCAMTFIRASDGHRDAF